MHLIEGQLQKPIEGEIVIVVSKFNSTITERLLDGAIFKLRECHVATDDITVCKVPGAFELPVVARRYAEEPGILAVICLGAVIKGETSHDEHINRAVSLELARIASETGIPVIFGLLTCNTVEQAIARSGGAAQSHDKTTGTYLGNKGYEAAEAALEMIHLMTQLPSSSPGPIGALSDIVSRVIGGGPALQDNVYNSPFHFDDEDEDDEDDDDDFFEILPRKRVKKTKKRTKSSKKAKKRGKK
ncbi:MAG: 6,7-dimethyl-8-ribityllumazine synthase [Planctomycetaceae bacterium]|nr:6,7-dimethyl-8-ribityllumazine synthase [Planctomycetaceae bacterium]